jgi:hypothetical protein
LWISEKYVSNFQATEDLGTSLTAGYIFTMQRMTCSYNRFNWPTNINCHNNAPSAEALQAPASTQEYLHLEQFGISTRRIPTWLEERLPCSHARQRTPPPRTRWRRHPRLVLTHDPRATHAYHQSRLPPNPCNYFDTIGGTSTGYYNVQTPRVCANRLGLSQSC